MSSRRRAARHRSASHANNRAPPHSSSESPRSGTDELAAHFEHLKSATRPSIHPALTDYNARGFMRFVRTLFTQDHDLPPLSPVQQSLQAFAYQLIRQPPTVADRYNDDTKTGIEGNGKKPMHKSAARSALPAEGGKGKGGRNLEAPCGEERSLTVLTNQGTNHSPCRKSSISSHQRSNSTGADALNALALADPPSTFRTASFEFHSSSSRTTSRRRDLSLTSTTHTGGRSQRRRKTPASVRPAEEKAAAPHTETTSLPRPLETIQHEEFCYSQLVPPQLCADHPDIQNMVGDCLQEPLRSRESAGQATQSDSRTIMTQEYQEAHSKVFKYELDQDTAQRSIVPPVLWDIGVLEYLSTADVKALRLTCKAFADNLTPWLFRSTVTSFGPRLFNIRPTYDKAGSLQTDDESSLLSRYGHHINKFGISFECDQLALAHAPWKQTSRKVDAWFGRYSWPMADYPYFKTLKEIDNLLDDDRHLLTRAMKNLTKCSELALSVDSGHGWLEGADLSDLAVLEQRCSDGSRVFGKAFDAPDKAYEDSLEFLFRWAQLNTMSDHMLYASLQHMQDDQKLFDEMLIRSYDSFRAERAQPDFEPFLHTGGAIGLPEPSDRNRHGIGVPAVNPATQVAQNATTTTTHPQTTPAQRWQALRNIRQGSHATNSTVVRPAIIPQWPLIFNGHNVSADGRTEFLEFVHTVASPAKSPLIPNAISESQAQWLMETSWIQRTFLSTYIEAVRINAPNFQHVHSLHIPKLSSGLIQSISQRSFWTALPSLRTITLLVKPDWRLEHRPGDESYHDSMQTQPFNAVALFADLLRDRIARLEHLNSLEIGYVGGGEHQRGLFGRNQHVLPAPVTTESPAWLFAQNPANPRPNRDSVIVFPHIRTLTFTNCWFSPNLFKAFMHKSRDTSLHNLILNSVSLTSRTHSSRTDGPLRTVVNNLRCQHSPAAWLNEDVPANASWATVLDTVTPGKTILDLRYDTNMIDENQRPRPARTFRGNIEHIKMKSCGYVMIEHIGSNDFNQNDVVIQNADWCALDDALKVRLETFEVSRMEDVANCEDKSSRRVQRNGEATKVPVSCLAMLSGRTGHTGDESHDTNTTTNTFMTGVLTQCIHPVEKRILESMWGMKFGWGDDMARWAAVEDGRFMGGTGRFSGEVFKDHLDQSAFNEAVRVGIDAEIHKAEQMHRSGKTVVQQASALHAIVARNQARSRQANCRGSVNAEMNDRLTTSRRSGITGNTVDLHGSATDDSSHLSRFSSPRRASLDLDMDNDAFDEDWDGADSF